MYLLNSQCKSVDEVKLLSELKANPKNPRKITDKKLSMLKKSLAEFGDLGAIIFNQVTGQLVGGHQRIKALPKKSEIVIERTYQEITKSGTIAEGYFIFDGERFNYREVRWDEAREKAANIAANKGAGEWEMIQLGEWFSELGEIDGFDLDLTMFDEDERRQFEVTSLEEGLTDADSIPETPLEATTRIGDIYILEKHRLMCGDSTSIDSVEKLMDGRKADMVFTDPPYGVNYEGGHNKKKRKGIKNDSLEGDSLSDLFSDSLVCAEMVSNDHAAFYIWYANGKAVETYKSFSKLTLEVRAVICWYKVRSGLGAFMSQYIPNYEPCIYAFKKGSSPQWFGPSNEKTVWELQRSGSNEYHPTQKPVELPERAICNSSRSGQIVLDLFGGSGSTLIACEKTNRQCFMMELDPKYCDVIVSRWEAFTGKKVTLVGQADLQAGSDVD